VANARSSAGAATPGSSCPAAGNIGAPMSRPDLPDLLARLPAAGADGEAVDDWIDAFVEWVLAGGADERTARLRELAARLASEGEAGPLAVFLREVWRKTSAVRFLAESGLPARPSFLGEAWSRIVDRFVPRLDGRFDLASLLFRLGLQHADVDWLAALPEDVRGSFAPLWSLDKQAVGTAALLVAQRAAAAGLSRPLLRLAGAREEEWPFLELPHLVRACLEGRSGEKATGAWSAWQRSRGRCLAALRTVHDALDERGVSTEVLYLLELIEAQLARVDELLAAWDDPAGRYPLALSCLRGSLVRRSVRALMHSKIKRLALEVVEHTGHTGEHYVSSTWPEFWSIGRAAAIGGAVTAGTATIKYLVSGWGLAHGVLGLVLSADYSLSFLAIHFLGGNLASKQPAMTAAALARSLDRDVSSVSRVRLIAGICRAQTVATAGNLLLTLPTALLIDQLFFLATSRPAIDAAAARYTLKSLHPLHSWTLLFAAITGALLWLSSMAAGWTSNWADYRSLPEAIRHSAGCRRLFGARGAAAVGRFADKHIGGIAGFLVLGLLLGFLPSVLSFMGVPLEVRHVTLSGASVALAAASQAHAGNVDLPAVAAALAGVLLIGLLNFTVSFALAFWVALRARDLAGADRRMLRKQVWRAFLRRPIWFLVPGRAVTSEAPPH